MTLPYAMSTLTSSSQSGTERREGMSSLPWLVEFSRLVIRLDARAEEMIRDSIRSITRHAPPEVLDPPPLKVWEAAFKKALKETRG